MKRSRQTVSPSTSLMPLKQILLGCHPSLSMNRKYSLMMAALKSGATWLFELAMFQTQNDQVCASARVTSPGGLACRGSSSCSSGDGPLAACTAVDDKSSRAARTWWPPMTRLCRCSVWARRNRRAWPLIARRTPAVPAPDLGSMTSDRLAVRSTTSFNGFV
jgi:hypothetical protein